MPPAELTPPQEKISNAPGFSIPEAEELDHLAASDPKNLLPFSMEIGENPWGSISGPVRENIW